MDHLIDPRYPLEGFYIRRPGFIKILRKLEQEAVRLMERDGYEPVLFPTLIPENVIGREVSHIKGFKPAVYWVTQTGAGRRLPEKLALAISSETVFCLAFKNWLADGLPLPYKFYQQRTVFRSEAKAVSPLAREKEFLWLEAHTAFAGRHECFKQIERDKMIVKKLLAKFGLKAACVRRPDSDRCPGAIITFGFDLMMPDGTLNQVASVHYLGKKFSRAFAVRADRALVEQTCLGIGYSRVIAALHAYGQI
jgi:prolyl-tRNA synthetase